MQFLRLVASRNIYVLQRVASNLRGVNIRHRFPLCFKNSSSARLLSTNQGGSDESNDADSSVASTAKTSDKQKPSEDSSSALRLSKPGGMGKAGLRRKMQEIGESDRKEGRATTTTSKEEDTSDSDDELMSSTSSASSSDEERETVPKEKPSELLTPEIRRAVKDVSKELGGNERQIRSELLQKLMQHERESYKASKIEEDRDQDEEKPSEAHEKGAGSLNANIDALLGGMKIAKTEPTTRGKAQPRRQRRSEMMEASTQLLHRVKNIARDEGAEEDAGGKERWSRKRTTGDQQYERTDFFDPGPGLGIFAPVKENLKPSRPPLLPVWENLEKRRLKQLTSREPRNGFEEMIRWTEEGKMYPYPIDNDYAHYEQNVPFHEHVLLDDVLDEGFPSTGPIRRFMELVIHGLSSNPYMTVEKKHGHIQWFREYFKKRGAEIEKLHELDVKHQQALAALQEGMSETSAMDDTAHATDGPK